MGELDAVDGAGTSSRRDLLKKAGVGAAIVWTAPIVTSAVTPAAAQTGAVNEFCPTTNSTPPCSLTFDFTNADGGFDAALQSGPTGTYSSFDAGTDVEICVTRNGGGGGTVCFTVASSGGSFTVTGSSALNGPGGKLNPALTFDFTGTKDGAEATGSFQVHTSCSEPLSIGDTFGSLNLTNGATSCP